MNRRALLQHLQAVDLGALAGRQGLVGGDAVGVARVALARRHLDGMQVGEQARLGQVIVVGVPVQPDLR